MTDPGARGAEIIRWPADRERRAELVAEGRPRLLVLERGVPAPPPVDDLEDVVWTPTDERDAFARLDALAWRARRRDVLDLDRLAVEEGRRLVGAAAVVELPKVEAALVACLLEPPRRVRTRAELTRAAWGEVAHRPRSLDSRLFTLRRRLEPLGLAVHSIHGRGFLLDRVVPG